MLRMVLQLATYNVQCSVLMYCYTFNPVLYTTSLFSLQIKNQLNNPSQSRKTLNSTQQQHLLTLTKFLTILIEMTFDMKTLSVGIKMASKRRA